MNTTITNYNRKNTWSPIQELRSEMDRLFDGFWDTPAEAQVSHQGWQPACDVVENQDHYLLSLEMAGIPKDQIQIEVIARSLVISGERKIENQKRENGMMYSERRFGKFYRSFALPSGLDLDKIEASHQDGVLQLLIPKTEAAKTRQIKITSGSASSFFGKLIGQGSLKEKAAEHSMGDQSPNKIAS